MADVDIELLAEEVETLKTQMGILVTYLVMKGEIDTVRKLIDPTPLLPEASESHDGGIEHGPAR